MDVKSLLKWGAIIAAVLIAWRVLAGAASGFSVRATANANLGAPQFGPNYAMNGVYAPIGIPVSVNPFYSSPVRGGRRGK